MEADGRGVPVDSRLRAGERLWAVGDITGIWPLTHVGKYQGEVVASNILGEPREADYDAVPRVVFTDPQAAAAGATDGRFSGTARLSQLAKTETYTRAYAESNGFLTLLADGKRLTGAYALGPEAGEWLQQATLAIRARVPIEVLRDTIQPFPTFSEIYVEALKALRGQIAARPQPGGGEMTSRPIRHHLNPGGTMVTAPALRPRSASGTCSGRPRRDWRQRRHRARDGPARARGEADVIITARNPDRLHRAGFELGASIAAFDATDFDRLKRFFDELPTPIDHVLVTGPGPYYAPLAEFDIEELRRDVDAHLLLPLQVARNAVGKVRPGGRCFSWAAPAPPHGAGSLLPVGAHRRASRLDEEPRTRTRADPCEPDRGRICRHAVVGDAPRRPAGRAANSSVPRCQSDASSGRLTSPHSRSTS